MPPAPRFPARVLIVDDHVIFRDGLRVALAGDPDIAIVGEAGHPKDALALAGTTRPDVVLLDADLGGFDALQIVGSIAAAAPGAAIVVIAPDRGAAVQRRALELGARGLVTKDEPGDVVLKAIRRVHDGELWFDRATVGQAVTRLMRDERPPHLTQPLSEREREIVELVGEGLRNDAIAARLSISEKTVRNHLSVIYEKIGVSDRLHLAIYAYRHGLARLPL